MTQEQLAALAKGLAPVVRECVATATAPLLEQIDALQAEVSVLKGIDHAGAIAAAVTEAVAALPTPKDGEDGKDADPAEIARMVAEAVDALRKPEDGKSVTVEDVEPLIDERVSAAVGEAIKAIPVPQDGKDGADGKDGESITTDDLAPIIVSEVEKRVAEIPVPKDGRDGKDGKDGKDGVGLAGALIDRSGNLIVTLTDGTQRDLGPVVGKDGDPGKPGVDGLGFDDMDMVIAEDGAALVFMRGEQKKAFALPIVFDRGVYKSDATYRKGNGVTWGGQFWIAQKDNPEGKPDASEDWRLAVKRGRDAPRNKAGE